MLTKKNPARKGTVPARRSPRLLLCIVIILLLVAGGGFAYKRYHGHAANVADNKIDYTPAKPSDNTASEERKNSVNPDDKTGTSGQTLDSTATPVPFSVSITGANIDHGSNTLYVGSLINGATAGTCTLTFSKSGSADISNTSQVALQNNSYVCPTFAIPTSKFTSSGTWHAKLTVNNAGSAASDETDVTI